MKKLLLALCFTLISSVSFAIEGTYSCSDGGTLELTLNEVDSYYANLSYEEGNASSTLERIEFEKGSDVGVMLRDDEEAEMGTATLKQFAILLEFDSGESVLCELNEE